MQGYYNNPEATKEVFDDEGWFHSGDAGYIINNYLYLTGRKLSLIVTEGGKNVFPEEIEDMFQLYDEVEQICVLGYLVDKKSLAEGIRAIIHPSEKFSDDMAKLHSDPKALDKAVLDHMQGVVDKVNKELLPYKRIERITITKEPLEMTSTKKVKRHVVAKLYKD